MMNKIGVVLGAAAIAVVAGCKDPNYIRKHPKAQDTVKPVATEPVTPVMNPDVKPYVPEEPVQPEVIVTEEVLPPAVPEPVVDANAQAQLPGAPEVAPAPAPAETTTYIVQRGDTLFLISKRYNIKLDALRKANPKVKNDVIKLGQKLTLPGKVAVGEQKVPEGAIAKPEPKVKAEYKPYEGETKEYVVKSGDYLGKIAGASGISIRQLKELNGLQSDVVRVGQKLRVPASAQVKAAVPKAPEKKPEVKLVPVTPAPAPVADVAKEAFDVPVEPVVVEPEPAAAPAAPAPADDYVTYIVQPGEDITALSIAFSIDPSVIRELNNMGDQDQVKPGQAIKLPPEAN